MLASQWNYIKTFHKRQHVRPWALAAPILVLVIALPLMRPLRKPGLDSISSNELSRDAAIEALADMHSQAIEHGTFFPILQKRSNTPTPPDTLLVRGAYYSDKPPMMAFLLSGPYWLMERCGITFTTNPTLAAYLLTLLGVTLPVAGAVGLIYRMGRLLELQRPLRAALAMVVALGSGLLSWSVVMNSNAPAAALVLAACTCLVHEVLSRTQRSGFAWFTIAGLAAALAATIDHSATVFLVGFMFVIGAMRFTRGRRALNLVFYLAGIIPPIILHAILTIPMTGSLLSGYLTHPDVTPVIVSLDPIDSEVVPDHPLLARALHSVEKILGALLGSHGLFSHFPVVVFGLLGIGLVLHRNWPSATKAMAMMTLIGSALIVLAYVFCRADWTQAMFGPRWFVVFLPLLLFWAGAWLRKSHHPLTWAVAAVLLLFSTTISLIGTTDPFVHAGDPYDYTARAAWDNLLHPPKPDHAALATRQ